MKHLFILNPKSFWYKQKMDMLLARIHSHFQNTAPNDYEVYISRFPRDATGFIRSYAKKSEAGAVLRVYAVGGDGILFDCLNGIMGIENAELAAIPCGHTNSFVRGFGRAHKALFLNIPLQAAAPAIPLDVIRCGNNYALNFCTLGLETLAVFNALKFQKRLDNGGRLARWLKRRLYEGLYLIGGFIGCADKKILRQHYGITIDGEDCSDMYRSIHISNGAYYGGNYHVIDSALPNDGLLDIMFASTRGILRIVVFFPAYLYGRYTSHPGEFSLRRGRRINIRSVLPLWICLDDNIFFENEITIEVLPGALRFVDVTQKGYLGVCP